MGFTLIELMIAVVIVAILAAVAVFAYVRHIRTARIVDAKAFIAAIQGREETYFHRFGQYCDVNGAHPSLQGTDEPVSKVWNPPAGGWTDLAARPESGRTFFSFNVRASAPPSHALFGNANADYGIPPQPTATGATPHPWYFVVGWGDLNGDMGLRTTLRASSSRNQVIVVNEGE